MLEYQSADVDRCLRCEHGAEVALSEEKTEKYCLVPRWFQERASMMNSTDCNVSTSNLWIYNTFPENVALVAASCRPLVVLHQHHDARGYLMRVQAAIYDFRSRNKKRSRVIARLAWLLQYICLGLIYLSLTQARLWMKQPFDSKSSDGNAKGGFLGALMSKMEKAAIGPSD